MHIKSDTILPFLLLTLILTGCYKKPASDIPEYRAAQSYAQLHLEQSVSDDTPVIAAWIPYFTVESLLTSDDPVQTENRVAAYLDELKQCGVNTVFVHVCAFGESSYPSAYYPYLPAANGYDAMRLFSLICKERGISFHAWINPMRLQTAEYTEEQSGDSLLHKWYLDPARRSEIFSEWNGRYYLNPASALTGEFLTNVITELISVYHPDGIHIDDYFYPTAETAFDEAGFQASGADDLAEWRRDNITSLVREMYSAVHSADPDAVFSVSPQGSLSENQNVQYADIPAWIGTEPCCDWIIPQIYFGYINEKMPFDRTLRIWSELPRNETVSLMIGLAAYKAGQPDPYAGKGADEWIISKNLLAEQTADSLEDPAVSGIAFYHADALCELPESAQETLYHITNHHAQDNE